MTVLGQYTFLVNNNHAVKIMVHINIRNIH